jgi:hypothetical protein
MESQTMNATFLKRSLQLDGVASGATGLLLLAAAGPFAALAGLPGPGIPRAVGGVLVMYAAALLWNAGRATVSRGQAVAAVVLNALWVLGSVVLIVDGPLTLIGNLAVAAVALAVLLFGTLEAVGLRRLQQA